MLKTCGGLGSNPSIDTHCFVVGDNHLVERLSAVAGVTHRVFSVDTLLMSIPGKFIFYKPHLSVLVRCFIFDRFGIRKKANIFFFITAHVKQKRDQGLAKLTNY